MQTDTKASGEEERARLCPSPDAFCIANSRIANFIKFAKLLPISILKFGNLHFGVEEQPKRHTCQFSLEQKKATGILEPANMSRTLDFKQSSHVAYSINRMDIPAFEKTTESQ
ncbi:hypothetical protein M514_08101 [Trichuris suis]|uniref:Uncharacterized protein n=1 Tax=Trichuris suis TaxID=68888 RepID=A0A085NUX7_9BILA|nr:hypothetical protein M514_08101 [Trichuris suis]